MAHLVSFLSSSQFSLLTLGGLVVITSASYSEGTVNSDREAGCVGGTFSSSWHGNFEI